MCFDVPLYEPFGMENLDHEYHNSNQEEQASVSLLCLSPFPQTSVRPTIYIAAC